MTAENPVGNIKLNEVKFEEKGGQSDTNLQSIFQLAGGGGKFGEATAEIKAKNNGQDDFFLALTGIMYSGNELLPTKAAAMMEQEAKRILTDKGIIGKGENVNSEALQVLAFQYLKIVDITDPQTSLLGRSRELVKEAILTAEESKLLKLNEAINAYNLAFLVKKSKKSRAKLEGDKVVISSRKIVELNGDSSQDQISALRTLLELGNLVDKSGQDTPIVQFKTSLVLNLPKDQEEITIHGVEFNKGLWIGDQTEAKVNGVTGNVIVRNLAQVEINSVEGKAWVQDSAQIEIGDGCENLIIEAVNTKFKGLVVYKGQVYTPVALEGLAESFQLIKDGELQKIRDTVKQVPLAKEPVSAGGSLESGNAYKLEKDGQQTMIISMGDNKWRVLEKGKDAREIDDAGLVDFGLRVKVDEAGETILEQQQLSIRDEEITLFSKKNELLGTKWLLDIDSLFYFAENYEDLGLVNRDGQAGLMKQLTVLLESKKIKSSEVAVAFEKDIGVSIYLTLDQIVQGLNQIDFQGFVFEMCETVINNKQFEVKTGVKNEGQGMNKKIVSKDTKTQLLENSGDNQEMWEQLYVGFEDNKFVGLVNSNDAWIIHNARQGKGEEEYKVLQKRVMSDLANYRYTKDIEARLRLLLPEKTAWYAIDERVEIAYDRTVSIDEKQWQPIRIRMKNERRRSLEDLQALLLTVNQDAPKMIEYDITFPNIDGRIRNDLVEIAARPERSLASDDPFGYPLELRIINFHSMIIEVMKELYQDAEAKKFNQAINAFNQNFPVEEGQAPRAKLEDGQVVISGKEKIRLNDQSPQAQISAVRDVCALGKVAVFENSVGFYLPEGQEKVTIQGVQFKAGLWIGDQTEAEVNGVMGNIVVRDSAQANVNGVTGSVTAYHLAQVEVGDDCKRVYLGNKFQGVVVYDGQVYTSQNPAGLKEEFQLIENGQLQDIPPTINQVPLEKEPVSAGGSLESGNAYKLEKDGQQTMIISMGKDKWRVFEKGEEPREIDDVGLVDFGLRVAVKIHEEKVLTAEEVKASEAIEKFNRVFEDQKVVAGLGEYGSVVIRGEKLDARDNDSEKQDGKTAALQAILDLYQEDGNGNIIKNVAVEAKIFAGNIRISGGRFEGVFAYGNTIISGGEFRWMGAHNNTIISGGKFNKEVSASDNTIISGGKFKEMHIYGNTIISGGECAKVWFIAAGYPCNAVFIHEGRLYTPRNPKDINAAIWKDGAINRELIGENGPVLKLEVELQKITEETELTLEPGKAMFIQDTPGKPVILVIPTGDEWDLRIINKNGQKRQVLSKEEMQTKLQELGLTVKIGEEVEAAAETTELTKAINNFNQAFLSESGEPRAKLENGQVVISGKEKIILDDQSSPAQISALKAVFALGKVAVFENSVSFYLPEGQEKVTIQGVQFKANLWIGEKTEAEVSGVAGRIVVQNSAQANVSEVTGSVTVFHSAQVEVGEGCEEVEYVKLGKGVNNKLPFQGAVVYDGLVYTSVDPDGLKEEFQLIEDGQLQDIPPTINQVPLEKEPVSAGGSLEPGKAYKIERDGKQTMIISTGDDSWRVLERGKDAREIDDAGLVEFGLSVKVGEAAEPAEPTGLDPAREAEATRLAEEINTIVESFQEQFSDFHVQINGNEIRVGNLWVDGQDKPVQQSALQGLMDLQGTKSGLETVNVRFDELFVKGTAEDTKLNIRGQEFKRIAVFDQAQVGEMKVGKVAENISVSGSAIVGISEKNEAEVRIGGAGMVVAENQAYIAREGYAHGYVVIIKKGGGVITNEELQVEADKGNRVDRYEIAAKEEKVDPKNSKVFKVEQKNKTIWIIPAQETGKWEVRESGEEPRELKDNDWIEFGLTVIIKAEKRTLPKVNSW